MTESLDAPAVLPAQTCWLIELAVDIPVAVVLLAIAVAGDQTVTYSFGGLAGFVAIMAWFDWRDHAPSRVAEKADSLPSTVRAGSPTRFAVAAAAWTVVVVVLAAGAFELCDRLVGVPGTVPGAVGFVMALGAASHLARLVRMQRVGAPRLYATQILRRRRYYLGPAATRSR